MKGLLNRTHEHCCQRTNLFALERTLFLQLVQSDVTIEWEDKGEGEQVTFSVLTSSVP